jgi:hypothetical protein
MHIGVQDPTAFDPENDGLNVALHAANVGGMRVELNVPFSQSAKLAMTLPSLIDPALKILTLTVEKNRSEHALAKARRTPIGFTTFTNDLDADFNLHVDHNVK